MPFGSQSRRQVCLRWYTAHLCFCIFGCKQQKSILNAQAKVKWPGDYELVHRMAKRLEHRRGLVAPHHVASDNPIISSGCWQHPQGLQSSSHWVRERAKSDTWFLATEDKDTIYLPTESMQNEKEVISWNKAMCCLEGKRKSVQLGSPLHTVTERKPTASGRNVPGHHLFLKMREYMLQVST